MGKGGQSLCTGGQSCDETVVHVDRYQAVRAGVKTESFYHDEADGGDRAVGGASSLDGVPIDAGLKPRLADESDGADGEDDGIGEELAGLEKQLSELKERKRRPGEDSNARVAALRRKLADVRARQGIL
eukprot:7133143-Karenia_brevis.AAC.1